MRSGKKTPKIRTAAAIAAAALVFLAAERIFLHSGESHHWWDGIPLFYGVFGAAGALTLVLTAKSLVMRLIKRKESYYDRN